MAKYFVINYYGSVAIPLEQLAQWSSSAKFVDSDWDKEKGQRYYERPINEISGAIIDESIILPAKAKPEEE